MQEQRTNFAVLMNLLDITSNELSVAIGADVTLISRWRTGSRKLVARRKWVDLICGYMLEKDAAAREPLLPRTLAAVYPMEEAGEPDSQKRLLERWLCERNQLTELYQERRKAQLLGAFAGSKEKSPASGEPKIYLRARGETEVQEAILHMLDQIDLAGIVYDMRFVCPAGLAILTMDDDFGQAMMGRLNGLFKKGSTLQVVLRTDYKMSEVSNFSGPWLAAHLAGYVKSHYYDDFRHIQGEKMIATVTDRLSLEIWQEGKGGDGYHCVIYDDPEEVGRHDLQFEQYLERSIQRFHYHFFSSPDDFLINLVQINRGICYLFSRLPTFGLSPLEQLPVPEELQDRVQVQFSPLFKTPPQLRDHLGVRHLFCSDDITDALDKPRYLSHELSDICGRRIYIQAQVLVDQLVRLREYLQNEEGYSACFLSASVFERLPIHVGAWNSCSIGWRPGGLSTACKDYTNVGALNGFCDAVWNKIPGPLRSKSIALRQVNTWLKRAKNFGYRV